MRSSVLPLVAAVLLACSTNQVGNIAAIGAGDLSFGEPSFRTFDEALQEQCGSGLPTAVGEVELGRLPYLQSVTASSARVLWTSAGAGTLTVRAADAPTGQVARPEVDASADPMPQKQWVTELAELRPATIYCYRISGAGGEPWTDWTGFRTAPGPGEPIELTALGDLGEDSDDQNTLQGVLQQLPTQAVLLTGDIAYPKGTLHNFEAHYFAVYAAMLGQVPFFPVGGNHDQAGDTFRQVFSLPDNGGPEAREQWYSFDWGDVHVVGLDTERVGPAQAAWLEQDLRAHADARWTIVMLHRPPYSSGEHGDTASVKEWFVPIFERAGVDLVLAGHDHNYERFHPKNGIVYVVTGGGGRGTRPVGTSADTAYSEEVIHLVHLRITEAELIGWAVDGAGKVFDTFRIEK